MLNMTDEQRYSAVLKELGAVLADKNTTISCQKWEIDNLKEKLAAAEAELAEDAKAFHDLAQKAIEKNRNVAALREISAKIWDSVTSGSINISTLDPADYDELNTAHEEICAILAKLEGGAA